MTHGTSSTQPQPSPAADALTQAATAYNHAADREQQGRFLNRDEQAAFTRDQTAARSHGFNDRDVRTHAATLRQAAQ